MRELYARYNANFPRLGTDTFFADSKNTYRYFGTIENAMRFAEDEQLLRADLWKRFVDQYREKADNDGGWRCEYWGKMMRGACLVYSYTKNEKLYSVLCDTVRDMMSTADADGRISSYDRRCEFDGWDIWGRKYVLLGMQYFLEICEDEKLCREITECMKRQADCIIKRVGNAPDKIQITKATRHWKGLNSASLLEPIVRLYSITEDKKYLDFAEYIVGTGFTSIENFIELAYKNELRPYQYPVTKAYEMTSCFEGLLEYYRVVKNDRYKTAVLNFADRILENDFTVIGSSGCTHELFDHSTVRQANTTNGKIMQETCVTVTLMKFFYGLHLLTGDSKYADAFEISLYNAYLGSFNTEHVIEPMIKEKYPESKAEPLPFDSYSPLTSGTRGNGIGGLKFMSGGTYYGCCACIGAAGIGLVPKMQVLSCGDGPVMNLYIDGTVETFTPSGNKVTLRTETDYPRTGYIKITVFPEKEECFRFLLRKPSWSENTEISAENAKITVGKQYIALEKTWRSGDTAELSLDMRTKAVYPIPYGEQILMNKVTWGIDHATLPTFDREDPEAKKHIALRRGPVMLAEDSRLGYDTDEAVDMCVDSDGFVNADVGLTSEDTVPFAHIVEAEIPIGNGENIKLCDYASAGKLWDESSKTAVWIKTKRIL